MPVRGHPCLQFGPSQDYPHVRRLLEARAGQGWVRLCLGTDGAIPTQFDLDLAIMLSQKAGEAQTTEGA